MQVGRSWDGLSGGRRHASAHHAATASPSRRRRPLGAWDAVIWHAFPTERCNRKIILDKW